MAQNLKLIANSQPRLARHENSFTDSASHFRAQAATAELSPKARQLQTRTSCRVLQNTFERSVSGLEVHHPKSRVTFGLRSGVS